MILRIAHVADTHLGYRSATIPKRDEDFSTSWRTACQQIVQAQPDIVIHAGDVFHRPHPSWGAVSHLLEGLSILDDSGVPVFLISGNHDSSRIATKHTVFSVLSGVYPSIVISYDDTPQLHFLPEMDTEIVLLSHQALVSPTLVHDWRSTISRLGDATHKILVSHGSVGDLEQAEEMGSVVVPNFVFDYDWSYVALGHLHMAQPYASRGWYSGSIERCGWSDILAEPAWTRVTLHDDGRVEHGQIPLPHLRMIQLPDLDCSDDEEMNIVGAVMSFLASAKVPEGRAVARIKLNGIHLYARRALQSQIQRIVRDYYPDLIFQLNVESTSSLWTLPEKGEDQPKTASIEEMFGDYVAMRTFEDESLRAQLKSTGEDALAKARESEAEKDPL